MADVRVKKPEKFEAAKLANLIAPLVTVEPESSNPVVQHGG